MERGFVSGIAMNGSAAIHDLEIALVGSTSEDVEESLGLGKFGMAEETGRWLNYAANYSFGNGYGEVLGSTIFAHGEFEYKGKSVLACAYHKRIPVTVHLAIGTDIVHMHKDAFGTALGSATHHDFRLFCALVKELEGGVYMNWGSAVLLPEIFMKAVSVARNLGAELTQFTTANFDMIQHYRPMQNVVRRPHLDKEFSKGYSIIGHHELMLPLFAACLKSV